MISKIKIFNGITFTSPIQIVVAMKITPRVYGLRFGSLPKHTTFSLVAMLRWCLLYDYQALNLDIGIKRKIK
jgi:hypothetical protein